MIRRRFVPFERNNISHRCGTLEGPLRRCENCVLSRVTTHAPCTLHTLSPRFGSHNPIGTILAQRLTALRSVRAWHTTCLRAWLSSSIILPRDLDTVHRAVHKAVVVRAVHKHDPRIKPPSPPLLCVLSSSSCTVYTRCESRENASSV